MIVTLNRMSLGVGSLLARIEATANWRASGGPHAAAFEPTPGMLRRGTTLGTTMP